jgi:hypothetical protein
VTKRAAGRDFTAGACRFAALAFAASPSEAQRRFAPTLELWAMRFEARQAPEPAQLELFTTDKG